MASYNYDIAISANSGTEADSKMRSLNILGKKLSTKELERLAHIVEKEPFTLALAKSKLGMK